MPKGWSYRHVFTIDSSCGKLIKQRSSVPIHLNVPSEFVRSLLKSLLQRLHNMRAWVQIPVPTPPHPTPHHPPKKKQIKKQTDKNTKLVFWGFTTVKRRHDPSNAYKGKLLIGVDLQFRGSVHHHHGRKHGGVQADTVLEKELRVLTQSNQEPVSSRQLGEGSQARPPNSPTPWAKHIQSII